VNFIRVELELALTLLRIATTEEGLGDREGAEKAQALALDAYSNVKRFWPAMEPRATAEERAQIAKLQQEVSELMAPRQ